MRVGHKNTSYEFYVFTSLSLGIISKFIAPLLIGAYGLSVFYFSLFSLTSTLLLIFIRNPQFLQNILRRRDVIGYIIVKTIIALLAGILPYAVGHAMPGTI